MAAMLNAQRTFAHFGMLLTVAVSATAIGAGFLSVEIQTRILTLAVVLLLLGAVERYFAFRIRLDEHLFMALATEQFSSTAGMDESLIRLGLIGEDSDDRTLPDRMRGAAGLCSKHRMLVVVQWLAMIALAITQAL